MNHPLTLSQFVQEFALGMEAADARGPRAASSRSGTLYQPGLGPHTEAATVHLVMGEMTAAHPDRYGQYDESVPYPNIVRQRCDLCLGIAPAWDWTIEVKMLRMMGDNGRPNDNMITHILSPYPQHRSALTDCQKLRASGFSGRKAIVIYAYEYPDWAAGPAVEAFEALAGRQVTLGMRETASFSGLVHPVHEAGAVFGWELVTDGHDR